VRSEFDRIPPNAELSEKLADTFAAMRKDNAKELRANLISAIVRGVVGFTVFAVALTLMIKNEAPGWAYWTLVLALLKK